MMKVFQSKFLICCALFLVLTAGINAQQTYLQGFEHGAGDTWAFTATPAAYNVPAAEDYWADTTVTNSIPPATGNRFWFMLDLDNPSGGGNFFHTLDFQTIDVSAFTNNTLTFKFYTIGYEAADSLGYILETDNGTTWNMGNYVDLNRNTTAWTLVEVEVPAGTQHVRLRLMAEQNGGSDFAGFDEVQLISSNGDVVPPVVLNAKAVNDHTLRLVFSEPLDATGENTANYTGISNLTGAVRNTEGDTVTLTYGAAFANGSTNTLTVTGVQDAAGNALANPFVYSFTWNGSTPDLVITEINYNPTSNDPDTLEFIEIYNNGDADASIGGLQLSGVVSMTFPALTLQPGGILLVAANKAACESFFAGQTFYPWNAPSVLTNGGNTLVIRNTAGVTIDSVQYDDAFPWPVEPDGQGPSAELLSPNLNNNDGANWKASTTATSNPGVFASPGIVEVASLAVISFGSARTLVQENAGTITVPVTVNNQSTPLVEARVRVVSASTAVAVEDYVLLDTVVTFPEGATTPFPLQVQIINDGELGNSRYLILQLYDFVAAEAGAVAEHVILINDDDKKAPEKQADAPISLRHLSSFDVDPTANATAEISAYDPASKHLFTTNISQNKLEVIDLKNPVLLAKIQSIDISAYGGGINSVAYSNGVVAVAVDAAVITDPGKIVFFDVNGVFISQVTVGSLPDHVSFTADGSKLLVANEGEPAPDYSTDPEGSVSVIDMTPGAANLTQANVVSIDFTEFNDDTTAFKEAGIRVFGPAGTVAQNLEPEYITVSADGKKAWVTLQEANAIAVLNLENNTVENIQPLGLKDYASQHVALDASDQTPGIFFNNWNVKGMYQPDALAYWTSGGTEYLLTANEGDVREWSGYAEIVRLGASAYKLDSAAFPDAAYLKRSELLGRLNVTTATGDTDGDGDFDEIHTFGGRSVSIWNATTGTLVWDSGDDLERVTAADPVYGPLFNASNSNNTFKNRSDDKGPEPEGVTIADIEGRKYAFTALERTGGVVVYDITDPLAPEYVQWINTRTVGSVGGDLGPEGIFFIPKAQSPNGRNLIVVSNEISGTLSIFEINVDKTQTGEYDLTKYAFDNLPAVGVYGDTIREGGISGLFYRDGSYRFIGDRGPNADAVNHPLANGQATLIFPFPDYAPKVWQVRPDNDTLAIEDFDFVKRPDGTGASGLPLPVGQGNTGEVAWSDTLATVVPNDPWGLDSEGITQDNEGNFWICDEYGVSIWKLDANFKVINRYTPFPHEVEDLPLDTLLGKRRANRGFEGIAYTPNGKIFALLQSPLNNPTAAAGNVSRIHRLVELDPATGAMRTFVYVHDPVLGQIRSQDWKIGDLAAVNNEEFLVLEHAERNGWNAKNIYKFSIAGATPLSTENFGGQTLEQLNNEAGLAANGIVPVQKTLFLDLLELGWERQHDKPEGLAIVNDSTVAVINDNDFGILSPNADGKIVLTGKTTRLYVFTLPADQQLDYVSPFCEVSLGNDLAICTPGSFPLSVAEQGFAEAVWSTGDTTLAILAGQTGIFSVEAATAFGCISRDTVQLTVNQSPAVNLGPNVGLCEGQTRTLDAGNAGAQFAWSSLDSTQAITIGAPGNYVVVVTNDNGCSATDGITIFASATPHVNLGADKNLCEGQNLTLSSGFPGAATIWSTGATTPAIDVDSTGTYTVQVTLLTGCSDIDTVQVNVNPNPVVDLGADTTLCEGLTLTLVAGNPGSTYLWSTGAATPTIEVSETDLYEVTVTNTFGCSVASDVAVSSIVCVGTEEANLLSQVNVFPNPTSGKLFIRSSEALLSPMRISVFNTAGQLVLTQQSVSDQQSELDLSAMPKGLYLLRLQSGEKAATVRVAVQ